MRAFVYISQETQPFTSRDLRDLLQSAINANREHGVTGCLHYESGYFMQYIEGDTDALDAIMRRIVDDTRHQIYYRVEEADLDERRFPDWFMWWEERTEATDYGTAISELTRSLKPFERLHSNDDLDRALAIYKQISYDHGLQGIRALKSESDDLAKVLSMAVHDLRAPVNTISSLIRPYTECDGKNYDPELVETAHFIEHSVSRMYALINGVLEHFDTDLRAPFESVDIGAVVDEIKNSLRITDPECEVLRSDGFPILTANALAFWRVLNCLITNGLKYNQSDHPRVDVAVEEEPDCWTFCVSDNGIGIDPKHQSRIFEMFQRLHTASDFPGTGVGLATCRKLVEQWQGRIWVSSSEGQGARFYFTFPKHQATG